ncbi:AAA family ATPase [Pelotomaculum sp. PtaB.Bin117]|uniref:AAA family ATPase n=1 Tax=Pelotomaculum sp. PtaB.Bin117 TaxID=1811694 RepID=UPI0009D48D97|nr:AAA family ATPase [Pelotomaculum sp. PtaB.Bin117]OPX90640.1 MAG: chromosome segregation protein [Pelotomaculum sp. PtaB.Bin117]
MRLAEVMVDGFGILRDLHLRREELDKNITIIYGMNEAGKSTLMEFIRAMLFGFKVKGGRVWEPLRGGSLGGFLVFADENGEYYRVERRMRGRRVKVAVTLPGGAAGDEAFLADRVLRGITPLVFRNVFGFDVEEMRRLEELGAGEVSAHVYGAGTGLRAGRLTAGTSRLREELNDLFKPAGTKPAINKLIKELENAEAAVRLLQKEPEQYGRLRREAMSLRADREKLESAKRDAELRKRRLEAAVRARESWLRLKEARQQLGELLHVPSFPESGVERLQALEDKARDLVLARADTHQLADDLQRRVDNTVVNEQLLERSAEIKALGNERGLQLERLRLLPEQAAEVKHAGEEYNKQISKLGNGYDQTKLASIDTSLPARETVEGYKLKFSAGENRRETAGREVVRLKISAGEKEWIFRNAAAELAAHKIPLPPVDRPPADREQALDVLENGMRRLLQIRAGLESSRFRLVELEQQKRNTESELAILSPRLLPPWLHFVLPAVLAVFIAAAFYGGMISGFLTLAAGVALWATVMLAGRRAAAIMEARRARLEEILLNIKQCVAGAAEEIEQLARRESELAEELKAAAVTAVGRPVAVEEEIIAARRALEEEKLALARAEDLRRVAAQAKNTLDAELQRLSGVNKELEQADRALASLGAEWLDWLKERGLPRSLTPSGALAYFDACEEAVKSHNAWQKSLARERETRQQSEAFLARLNNLLANTGYDAVTMETACGWTIRLEELLSETVKQADERGRLQAELVKRREQKMRQENALNILYEEIEALLAAGGAVEPEDFRRRAYYYSEGKRLAGEIQTFERDLKIIAGLYGERAQLERELEQTEGTDNERELEQIAFLIGELEDRVRETGEQIGRLDNQINLLENGEELAVRLQEKEMLIAALQGKAREWQARALCLHLLKMAKERHERERQPAVLQRASGYIGPMTGGAYAMVIAPVGRADILEVETPDGGRVAVAGLSRGAASQLYLSIRLALARQYGSVGLPVILDDILVDFDRERLRGAVKVLGEFSRERQVLLFTCHEHILETFNEGLDGFGLIRLRDGVKSGILPHLCSRT